MPELLGGQDLSLVILSVPTVRQMKLLLAKAPSSSEQWPTGPDLSVQEWIYFPQCLSGGKLVFRPCFSLGLMRMLSWLFPGSVTSESRVNSCQGTSPSLPLAQMQKGLHTCSPFLCTSPCHSECGDFLPCPWLTEGLSLPFLEASPLVVSQRIIIGFKFTSREELLSLPSGCLGTHFTDTLPWPLG